MHGLTRDVDAGQWKSPPSAALKNRRSFSADRLSQRPAAEGSDSPLQSPESVSEDELIEAATANGHSHQQPLPRKQRYLDAAGSSLYQTTGGGSHQHSAIAGRHQLPPRRAVSLFTGLVKQGELDVPPGWLFLASVQSSAWLCTCSPHILLPAKLCVMM